MRAFAELIDRLIYTRSRNSKLALIADYLRQTPDPDRGWALAALVFDLDVPSDLDLAEGALPFAPGS